MPAIEVIHLTKEYRLGGLQSLRQSARRAVRSLLNAPVQGPPPFKALDDVTFSVEPGEVVGIIGHNGAGKSTLLKMLARISTPTRGSCKVNGRIAPLIEVGAGFVGDFTGRENVYLNGAILGMSRNEIARKFDEIVDFAGMSQFIDTPVKRYSSGMQVKLAFAVATSLESEVLIVDEVLAVGDLAFQRKCFSRMEFLIKDQQRTVLLVSHNIRQVERLCSRAILMGRGRVLEDGPVREVCNTFYEQSDANVRDANAVAMASRARSESSGDLDLLEVALLSTDGSVVDRVTHGAPAIVRICVLVKRPLVKIMFGLGVHTVDFIYLGTAISDQQLGNLNLAPGMHTITFAFDSFPFSPGAYSLRLGIDEGDILSPIFYAENILSFQVYGATKHRTLAMQEGFVELSGNWGLAPAS